MLLSVWTTLGRLEWADAFGRGSGGCGSRCCYNNQKHGYPRCCFSLGPLGPGSMRNLRVFLFVLCTILNIVSIATWKVESLMQFTHWLTLTSNVYLFCALWLTSWLHDQDDVTVEIIPFGRFVW